MRPSKRRHVLEGVPRVAFAPIHDGRYEFTPLPSCLKAICAYLGRPLPYPYLVGASGAAFRMVWHAEHWEPGNVDVAFMAEDPLEPLHRSLAAAGLDATIRVNATGNGHFGREGAGIRTPFLERHWTESRDDLLATIAAGIDAGRPVLAFGVVGPPEASIIAGYDDHGDTLVGWSLFQDHLDETLDLDVGREDGSHPPSGLEPGGYFRRDDWFRRTAAVVGLALAPQPDRDAVYAGSLPWIARVMRGGRAPEFLTGLAALDAYLEALADDRQYPSDDAAALRLRKTAHYDAMTMIAERGEGARYLRAAALSRRCRPASRPLDEAAEACEAAAREMAAWWEVVGPIWDDEPAQVRATADPDVRRRFVPHVRAARELHEEATRHVESAVALLAG